MLDFDAYLYSKDGKKRPIEKKIVGFFAAKGPFGKIWNSPSVIWKLAKKYNFRGFFLLIKAFVFTMSGKVYPISPDEYKSLWEYCLGEKPELLEITLLEHGIPIKIPFASIITFPVFSQVFLHDQYGVIGPSLAGKTVVDAGANVGYFSVLCALLGAKKVYAFEPMKKNYNILKYMAEINLFNDKIIPINMGLGDEEKNEMLNYFCDGDGSASMKRLPHHLKSEKVALTTIDKHLKTGEKIGLIKIDTEGYEKKILIGAGKIIQTQKPLLMFSAYHNPKDKQELKAIVKSIRKDYDCILRKEFEEVIFCE